MRQPGEAGLNSKSEQLGSTEVLSEKRHCCEPALSRAMVVLLALLFLPGIASRQESDDSALDEEKGELFEQRRDPSNGIHGWFAFEADSREYRSEWGYADTELLPGGNRMRLTLLSSPVASDFYPVLRIIVLSKTKTVDELLGQELKIQRVRIRLNPETERNISGRGAGTVILDAREEGWLEGRYEFELDNAKVRGTFRARFHPSLPTTDADK